jgi:hypothetical protein
MLPWLANGLADSSLHGLGEKTGDAEIMFPQYVRVHAQGHA